MKYRVTILTPTLVGDGQKLSPIDYMIWKDQVNVLDQRRIFRLLSRGTRLEGYLSQLSKAQKLDFASWGGFAQNYAGRRIPFEHASSSQYWEKTPAEYLHIPTFCSSHSGPFLPASALKGALRTGVLSARASEGNLKDIESRAEGGRLPRRMGDMANSRILGGSDPLRLILAGDSSPAASGSFKVYALRVSTLAQRGSGFELAWKTAPRGNVPGRTPDSATPIFVEMAVPGATFEGAWSVRAFLRGRREGGSVEKIFASANEQAAKMLDLQRHYAESAQLPLVATAMAKLSERVSQMSERRDACVLNIGWGGGFAGKTPFDTTNETFRGLLRRVPEFERAIRSGMPFPKTRRVVFERNQPATLPGWALLEVLD